MIKKRALSSFLLMMIATLSSACGASIDEYKKFSKAGQVYSVALENLLVRSTQISIDRTSEELLIQNMSSNATREIYGKLSRENKLDLQLLKKLLIQTRLLRSYFNQLERLSTSNSQETASSSTQSFVNNIIKLSGELKKDDKFKTFVPSVVKISISNNISRALRNELNIRGEKILEALEIHEQLISYLQTKIADDIKAIAEYRETRNVVPPIISKDPIGNPEKWIQLRKETLNYNDTIAELSEASQSLTEFKFVFKAILEDKLTSARIESFLKEVDDFIKIVEKNKVAVIDKVEKK
jgi:hypothetical protein